MSKTKKTITTNENDIIVKNTNKKVVLLDAELSVSLLPGQEMLVIEELGEKALKIKGVIEVKEKKKKAKKKKAKK